MLICVCTRNPGVGAIRAGASPEGIPTRPAGRAGGLPLPRKGRGRRDPEVAAPAARSEQWRAKLPSPRREPYCTVEIMSNMGMYMATTMPPITTPITTIMMGSSTEVSAVTAASTSSS